MIILKILGIILLVVVALIIFTLILILFVPIRYNLKGSYNKKIGYRGIINISYLLRIIKFKILIDDEVKIKLSIFNHDVFRKKSKKKNKLEDEPKVDSIREDNSIEEISFEKEDRELNLDYKENSIIHEDIPVKISTQKRKKLGFKTRLKHKIYNIKFKIKESIDKIKRDIFNFKNTYEVYVNDDNRKMISKLKPRIIKVLRHIFPKSTQLKGELGFEDPSTTAKLYSLFSLVDTNFCEIDIKPNFEEYIINIKVFTSGRIIMGYVLYHGLIIYTNKTVRKLIKK